MRNDRRKINIKCMTKRGIRFGTKYKKRRRINILRARKLCAMNAAVGFLVREYNFNGGK
jgi:hypothetical protein